MDTASRRPYSHRDGRRHGSDGDQMGVARTRRSPLRARRYAPSMIEYLS